MTPARLSKAAWLVVAYCVAVILWGSVVRATGSGAGCGGHWPTCDGAVLIIPTSTAMWFELAHRASSGLLLVLVKMLIVATFRTLPAGHPARRSVAVAGGILVVEALLGAGLVLFGLVADNDSLARAVVIAIHLTNTMALLAFLTLTALLAARRDWRTVSLSRKEDGPTGGGWLGVALAVGLASLVVVGASGAVTALGDTLFPARTLGEALRDDASPTAHLLVRMRVLHPVVAK
ncbi:MAG: heme A synthase, partial [Armatimonadetes bacterium]|nr:heme A synthase [Armatimonadota bacterium]